MKIYNQLLKYYKKLKLQISSLDNNDNLKTITTAVEENLQLIDSQYENIKESINLHMVDLNNWKEWYSEFFVTLLLTILFVSLGVLGTTMIIGTSFSNFTINNVLAYIFLTLPAIDLAISIPFSLIKTKIKTKIGLSDALRGIKAQKEENLLKKYENLKNLYVDLVKIISNIKTDNVVIDDSYFQEISNIIAKVKKLSNLEKRKEFLDKIDFLKDYYEKAFIEIKKNSDTKYTETEMNLKTYLIKQLAEIEFSLDSEIRKENIIKGIQEDADIVEEQITTSRGR